MGASFKSNLPNVMALYKMEMAKRTEAASDHMFKAVEAAISIERQRPTPEGFVAKRSTGLGGGGSSVSQRLIFSGHRDHVEHYPGLIRQPAMVNPAGNLHGGTGFAPGDPLAWILEMGAGRTPAKRYMSRTFAAERATLLRIMGARDVD